MNMETVIEKTCRTEAEERLFRAVVRRIGSWSDIWDCPIDYRDAGSGVSGFIYYSDTEPFAKRHIADILRVLNEFESDIGEPLKKDLDNPLNWYAWFALEHTIQLILDYQER